MKSVFGRASLLLVGLVSIAGCTRPAPTLAPTKPAEVIVGTPIKKIVTDYEDFTGRTEPILMVDVRSRVSGYLKEIHFVDGREVKAGQPLFEIDPLTFKAILDQSIATVSQAQARLNRLQRDYDRLQAAVGTNAVTQEEFDRVAGDRAEAVASLDLAKATKNLAKTNFDYATITAPIAGRISRRMMDKGNLVKADDTVLTTIVALDQIYATFDIDERTLLKIRRLIQKGEVDSARNTKLEVEIGLADEEGFSHKAVVDFIDNKVDPATGTLRVRAIMDNPKKQVTASDAPAHLLSPGLFVRIRLPVGKPHEAILVPEEALGSDQGQKYVYVLNDKDEVVYRRVQIGQQSDQDRVITQGVQPGERVIISGLQRVRPGAKVTPKKLESTPATETKTPAAPTSPAKTPMMPSPKS